MIELTLFNDEVEENNKQLPVYEFKSPYKINIIGGNSGTGKTLFYSNIEKALTGTDGWDYKCNCEIVLVNNLSTLRTELSNRTNAVVICDEDIVQSIFDKELNDILVKSKNYFILISRALETKIDTNVRALYTMNKLDSIDYNGIERYSIQQLINLKSINEFNANVYYISN